MTRAIQQRSLALGTALLVPAGITLFNRLVVRVGPPANLALVLSACSAIAVLALMAAEWPRSREWIVPGAVLASATTLLVTLLHEPRIVEQDAFWIVAESISLFSLVALLFRMAPKRSALLASGMVLLATSSTFLRVTPQPSSLDVVGGLMTWGFGAAAAAALGFYLRALDDRRARMVNDARRAQRLEVARDLHDFVAHDVTGIVVQAQAAHVVARHQPDHALTALARIEEAGLRALHSLDATVGMLGRLAADQEANAPAPVAAPESRRFDLDDLFALVGRFAASDARPVQLHADLGTAAISVDVVSAAYRVLAEALTNVRRHAPASAHVRVHVATRAQSSASDLMLQVVNSGLQAESPALQAAAGERAGGYGLDALTEYVAALGGELSAGTLPDGGWQTTAIIPLTPGARA